MSSASSPPFEEPFQPTPFRRNEWAQICDELLVHGVGQREIEIDERERLAEDEAREVTEREDEVRSRKRRLQELTADDEESTSEKEDERQQELRDLDREIESLGDSVRAPDPVPMDTMQSSFPEPPDHEITEPPPDARRSAMWEPTFAERSVSRQDHQEQQRASFMRIYPGSLDQRHAAVRALLAAVGPRPSLGMPEHVDLARSSLMLLTRKTEDDLLRTPKSGERVCRNKYECAIYKYHGKVARECLFPEELQEFERSGALPAERRSCLGCLRYNVTWFWMYMRRKGEHAGTSFITSHYNITNRRGEYLQDQCLLSSNFGLPLPVVPFTPGGLSPKDEMLDGEEITRFVQVGMVELGDESGFP